MFTRVRAVLAGALVLGVGGSLTLAAWTDTEYAAGRSKRVPLA
ncbi:SipW-dependent-type signal peptide-containing protein [Leucobacter salsicius]